MKKEEWQANRQAKTGSVVVEPLRKEESRSKNSHWRMNAQAGLGAEAKLQASSRGWLWNWGCGVLLTWTVRPLSEMMSLQALMVSMQAAKPLMEMTSLQVLVLLV